MTMQSRIKQRLSELDLSVNAAQVRMGKGSDFLKQYLMGRTRGMNTENLLRLAIALETSPEWLLEGRGEQAREGQQTAEVINIWSRIPAQDKDSAKRMLEGLARSNKD